MAQGELRRILKGTCAIANLWVGFIVNYSWSSKQKFFGNTVTSFVDPDSILVKHPDPGSKNGVTKMARRQIIVLSGAEELDFFYETN